nr:hypothetical protein [Tanacetum cinerariifolium]
MLGIKCTRHPHCQLYEFSLAEQLSTASEKRCHCQKKSEATARKIALLSKVKKKLVVITLEDPIINSFQQVVSDLVPTNSPSTTTTDTTSGKAGTKSGRTVTLTAEDMQKKKNDAAILKTFSGNEATKKTKKNLLKQQYGIFKVEGSETWEQAFTRLQVIVGQPQFMDVEIEQDDLNQKFLTSLALEWLMHTIVWRNRSDLDTMSLDDLYNHLKDWSYMANNEEDHALVADEVAPIEFALMANTSAESKVFDNSLCSKDSLVQVESRLVAYKEREVKYCEKIRILEFYNESNNECIEILKKKLETLKEEKEGVDGKLAGLLKASKDLDNLIESQ